MKKQAESTLGLAGMLWNELAATKLLVDTSDILTSQYSELGTKTNEGGTLLSLVNCSLIIFTLHIPSTSTYQL